MTTHIVELVIFCTLDKLPGRAFDLFKSLPSVNIDHCYLAFEGRIQLPAQHLSDNMQVISCGKLWARLPLWWGLIWSQWLLGSEACGSAPGSHQSELFSCTACWRWTSDAGFSFQGCYRESHGIKEGYILGGLEGAAVLFLPLPSRVWLQTNLLQYA